MLSERSTAPAHQLGAGLTGSRWGTELLAIKIRDVTGCPLHVSTIRRWLPAAGLVWRRAAPTLRIREPHKEEKMVAIHEALSKCSAENPVFYEDEVDIHLNGVFLQLFIYLTRVYRDDFCLCRNIPVQVASEV